MNEAHEPRTDAAQEGLSNHTVTFAPGHILKASMLHAVAHDDRAFLTLSYGAYADGPVVGLDFQQNGSDLLLTPGIVKWRHRIFASENRLNLSDVLRAYEATQGPLKSRRHPYQIVLRFADVTEPETPEIKTYVLRPTVLLPEEECEESDLLLLRFHGGFGSELTLPEKLADCTHDENVDIVDTVSAVRGGQTFVSYIFRLIQRELQRKKQKDVLDTALLMQLAAEPLLPIAALRAYVEGKNIMLSEDVWSDHGRETILQSAVLPAIQTTLQFSQGATATAVSPEEEASPIWEAKSKML